MSFTLDVCCVLFLSCCVVVCFRLALRLFVNVVVVVSSWMMLFVVVRCCSVVCCSFRFESFVVFC